MPGKLESSAGAGKRKRVTLKEKPMKRARSESSDDEDAQSRILLLESEIFESKKHYNNISTLIGLLRDDKNGENVPLVAAIALCRVFSRLLASGDLTKKEGAAEKDTIVVLWLKERYSECKEAMLDLLSSASAGPTILTLIMRLLKNEGTYLRSRDEYSFPTAFLTNIVEALLDDSVDESLRQEYSEKYVEEYDDIRYYTFEAIDKTLTATSSEDTAQIGTTLEILTAIDTVPESKDELEDFYISAPKRSTNSLYSLNAHKKKAQGAWLVLLKQELSKDQKKRILGLTATNIAPWFMKPELLMDFLTDAYNDGGSTSHQALSGVFYLIQERNLDYPAFYHKLYSLLDASLLYSKHRSKFFRLLDTFLASTHLPATLVASFIKRLARLTLNGPPAGVVAVVPWIYNLLKKHPTCTFMIHREFRTEEEREQIEQAGLDDPFKEDEESPYNTNAYDSSLWEIVMLQTHYHPNVATIAKIISEQFTKHSYNLEDFLDHSYGSMLEAELSKELKKAPVIEFEIPQKIITRHEEESGIENSLLSKLWDFA